MKSKITFKQESETYVGILLNGQEVGHIFSEMKDGTKPYPHKDTEYCNTSVQLCGFDKCSEIWGCGIFAGKKDLVVNFRDNSTDYMVKEEEQYREYVRQFLNKGVKMDKLVNFGTWVAHLHQPALHRFPREKDEKSFSFSEDKLTKRSGNE